MEEAMLIGEFQHNIDEKGRVFIPARLRDDLGERFIITRGLDGCLSAYSQTEWKVLETHIRTLPMSKSRDLKRFFFSSANEVTADKQGRIVVPPNLRADASLEHDVMIIGASSHIEIWDKKKWDEICSGITSQSIAEAMDELQF
jgi:MraZ protein